MMDDVLGRPAENEQQVRINVLDAPAPERVGILMRLIMWTIILGRIGWLIAKLLFEPLSETLALSSLAGIGDHGRVAGG